MVWCVCVCVCVCERERERERGTVCVCVCVRESVCVHAYVRAGLSAPVFVDLATEK